MRSLELSKMTFVERWTLGFFGYLIIAVGARFRVEEDYNNFKL
jgi:hypothetical protein